MTNAELWDAAAARDYDTPGTGMFAPEVLGPALKWLAAPAEGGAALEFAIGAGRVALALRAKGVAVSGIKIAPAMLARLREKTGAAELPVVLGGDDHDAGAGRLFEIFLCSKAFPTSEPKPSRPRSFAMRPSIWLRVGDL